MKVKVCGLTEVDNALACAEAGADWIGLNFHPASPRSISVERGAEIVAALIGEGSAHPVAVFVDRPYTELAEVMKGLGTVDTVQLHGDEDLDFQLRCSNFKIVRAFRVSDAASLSRMADDLNRAFELGVSPHAVLVDAHVPGQRGGTGRSISLDLLDNLPAHPRLILAGGLTPSNVADRVDLVRPWMVDVASGVESSPGVKDISKVSDFIAAARSLHVR